MLSIEIERVDRTIATVIVFDIIAFVGGLILISSAIYKHPDLILGTTLLTIGILTKVWKKEFNKKK